MRRLNNAKKWGLDERKIQYIVISQNRNWFNSLQF